MICCTYNFAIHERQEQFHMNENAYGTSFYIGHSILAGCLTLEGVEHLQYILKSEEIFFFLFFSV